MKFWLKIECENCGFTNEYLLKRTVATHNGKTYEDYTSISDTLSDKGGLFQAQCHPEGNVVSCGNCRNEHNLET